MIIQDFIGYVTSNTKVLTDKNKIKISNYSKDSISKILFGYHKLILYPIEDIINKISISDYSNKDIIPIVEIAEIIFKKRIYKFDIINTGLFYGVKFEYLNFNIIFAYWIEDCEFEAWWADEKDIECGDSIELKNTYIIYDMLNRFHIDYRNLINEKHAINIHSLNKHIY